MKPHISIEDGLYRTRSVHENELAMYTLIQLECTGVPTLTPSRLSGSVGLGYLVNNWDSELGIPRSDSRGTSFETRRLGLLV
ncbi:hypothetical protein RRG08_035936 [Elysia crispata]|uniref:Uncharacterized protein n=1 Tax=Elysia crispata TaxID=231223 RepID=A0AAE1A1R1_9GAST|nr:hypothetical protein RRG08_035936 [Elysia crispata]